MNTTAEAFAHLRAALEGAGVRFAVGGSWASTAFGEARFTHHVDILVDLTVPRLERFFSLLPETLYADLEGAKKALALGRPFNVIYMPAAAKFDLFPASAYPLGEQELERSVILERSGLAEGPTPFVSPEDILLAKLHWYRAGGQVSEVQWRDIRGLLRSRPGALDREYLRKSAVQLGVEALLERALQEA